MATSYTSLLGLALPVTGELDGTWGDTVNNAITSLLDTAIAGTTTLSTDADVTLSTTTGASNQARQAILLCSGSRSAIRNITAPAQSKIYVVINSTTGGFGVKIRGAGPTTGVTVASGKTAVVVWNGSDFVEVAPATATTATNLAGGLAGSVPYQSGANTTTFLAIGANNTVMTSNGTAPGWTASTGTGSVVRASAPTIATSFFNSTISSHAATRLGLDANSIWVWGADASTQGALAVYLRSSDGSAGSNPVNITSAGLNVTGATTSSTSLRTPLLIGGTGTTSTLTLRSTSGVGATGADIIFQTGNNGATEAMRVLNSGNVGIGTATPGQKLVAVGAIESLASNGYRSIRLEASTGTDQAIKAINYLGATYNAQLSFYTDNNGVSSEKMRIDSAGNVGIGTTSPTTLLQAVQDQNADTSISVVNPNTGTAAAAMVQSGSNSATAVLAAYGSGWTPAGVRLASSAALFTSIATTGGLSIGARNAAGVIRFSTGGDTERMRIDSAGNVGIGTSTVQAKLHVLTETAGTNDIEDIVLLDRRTSGTAAAGLGSRLLFTAERSNGFAPFNQAGIAGFWENAATLLASLAFYTRDGSALVERMRIDSAGNVGINTTPAAGAKLLTVDSSTTLYTATSAALSGPVGARVVVSNSSATTGTYGGFTFAATNAGSNSASAYIGAVSNASNYVCDIVFGMRTGATAYAERARIDASGNLLVTGIGGLGYGTGSGGAVTQGTSRTTGVTLDKTNGAITLFSAAGTTTWQSFTVTNNKVAATDTVVVSQKSGTDLYQIFVTAVAAGSFRISFATTGGTTTEQPVFNFAVIKAVTA